MFCNRPVEVNFYVFMMKSCLTLRNLLLPMVFLMAAAVGHAQQSQDKSVQVCLAGKCESGELELAELEQSRGLLISAPNGDKIAAEGFSISYNIGEREFSCQNEGYMISEECLTFISKMKLGYRFRIHEIRYGEGMIAPVLEFKIVE